jgi:hypothetical protein
MIPWVNENENINDDKVISSPRSTSGRSFNEYLTALTESANCTLASIFHIVPGALLIIDRTHKKVSEFGLPQMRLHQLIS